jgi:hypothetical protein
MWVIPPRPLRERHGVARLADLQLRGQNDISTRPIAIMPNAAGSGR